MPNYPNIFIVKAEKYTRMMVDIRSKVKLNNEALMPIFGLGVYQSMPGKETEAAVRWALADGYRLVDTAAHYQNETDVGRAVRESGLPREEIFVTTKLNNPDHAHPKEAFYASLKKLGGSYIDLYLIHWPVEGYWEKSWKVLEDLAKLPECRGIGVSNFTINHLEKLLKFATIVPAVNQVEFHPLLYQKDLLAYCQKKTILLEAYSPLGRGKLVGMPAVVALGKKYGKTGSQVLLRWGLQHGIIVIPKSVHRDRIAQNSAVFDFKLSTADMAVLDRLDQHHHFAWNPEKMVLGL